MSLDADIDPQLTSADDLRRERDQLRTAADHYSGLCDALEADVSRLHNAAILIAEERDRLRAALDATAQATSCHSCVRSDGTDVIAELAAERDRAASLLACVMAERDDLKSRLGRLRQYLKVIADDASNIVTAADAAERSLG